MADIVKINKNIQYQASCVVYGLLAGETKPIEFINKNFASHIIDAYLKDGTFELFTQKQEEPVIQNAEIDLKPIDATQNNDNAQDTSNTDIFAQDSGVQDDNDAQNQSQNIDTQPVQDGNEADTQDNTQPQVFEIVYKTTQSIQDKDGNEIEVGSQFTESELKELIAKDKCQSKKKIAKLLAEEKLMEIKIAK